MDKIILLCLLFINYNGFWGTSSFPTWRILNITLIFILLFKSSIKINTFKILYSILIISFLIFNILQFFYLNVSSYHFRSSEFIYIISSVIVLSIPAIFYDYFYTRLEKIILIINISIIIQFIYQLFQITVYYSGYGFLTHVLNEENIETKGSFLRIIGPLYGPSGFMIEAGHLALWIGPYLIFYYIRNYYLQIKSNVIFIFVCLVSMVLTLSAGAVIQISLFITTFIILNLKIKKIKISNLGFAFILAPLFFLTFYIETLITFLQIRITNFFNNVDSRSVGATQYWDVFYSNFWLGVGPKSNKFIAADPNSFFAVTFAEQGIIGELILLSIIIIPFTITWITYFKKYFILVLFAIFLHLILAYGTFTWPFIWINYLLAIIGMKEITKQFTHKTM